MYLTIHPVTEQNREEILSLKVKHGQEHFIETTAQCLTEADKLSVWRPVGIYDKETLIGFAMYGLFWNIRLTAECGLTDFNWCSLSGKRVWEKLHYAFDRASLGRIPLSGNLPEPICGQ